MASSDTFDPYYEWLGIRPDQQPADHYRLLGVDKLESDVRVIEVAADQRMAYVRQFQMGRHMAASQRLLNEVTAAKLCLLDPSRKENYDRGLMGSTGAAPQTRSQDAPQPAKSLNEMADAIPAAPIGLAPDPDFPADVVQVTDADEPADEAEETATETTVALAPIEPVSEISQLSIAGIYARTHRPPVPWKLVAGIPLGALALLGALWLLQAAASNFSLSDLFGPSSASHSAPDEDGS